MPMIHLVVGEKGGVGKSQVALALIAHYTSQEIPLIICEADRSNGDVGRASEGKDGHTVLYPYFTEDADHTDKADDILDRPTNDREAYRAPFTRQITVLVSRFKDILTQPS